MSDSLQEQPRACRGCGDPRTADEPIPEHCDKCPPWLCDQCGQLDSYANKCGCWTELEGMNLADLKAAFALGDLSLETL